MEQQKKLGASDAHASGLDAPEVIGFSLCHKPGDETAVNGFKFDLRLDGKNYTVTIAESDAQNEPGQNIATGTASLASGEKFLSFVDPHHKQIEEVQTQILEGVAGGLSFLNAMQK